jgi:hypothetical protein
MRYFAGNGAESSRIVVAGEATLGVYPGTSEQIDSEEPRLQSPTPRGKPAAFPSVESIVISSCIASRCCSAGLTISSHHDLAQALSSSLTRGLRMRSARPRVACPPDLSRHFIPGAKRQLVAKIRHCLKPDLDCVHGRILLRLLSRRLLAGNPSPLPREQTQGVSFGADHHHYPPCFAAQFDNSTAS